MGGGGGKEMRGVFEGKTEGVGGDRGGKVMVLDLFTQYEA